MNGLRQIIPSAALLALLGAIMAIPAPASAQPAPFAAEIRPLLAEYCFGCHGPEKEKGDLRLDQLDPDLLKGHDAETWQDVLDQLNLGEMPPEKAERHLPPAERKTIATWINESLREAASARRFSQGRVVMRRLTRYEYENTIHDLLGISTGLDLASQLPPEPVSANGFLNDGATLEMSPTQVETYLAAARRALDVAIVEGDRPEPNTYSITETARGNLPNKREGGQLPANPEFAINVLEYPRTGRFQLRITARASIPEGEGYPRLRASMGHIPGIIHIPRKTIGEVELTNHDEPQTFTFHGRMEDYPQSGDVPFRPPFYGMILMLDFLDADGKELRYPDHEYVRIPPKPKKGQEPKPKPTPPPFGSRLEIKVDQAEFIAPYYASWPPPSHRLALGDEPTPDSPAAEKARARTLLARFMERAFRRPVTLKEITPYAKLFERFRPESESFEEALRETFAAVLVSPQFLYIVEKRDPKNPDPQPLTPFELATRLSYFLWSTGPDAQLHNLAKKGDLAKPAVLKREIERLLADDRSDEFVTRFADQWFDLGALDRVAINPEFYPGFDNNLKDDMREETIAFFDTLLRENRSCLELIDSDWTMLNRSLANHYGITPAPRSNTFQEVALKPDHRRGGVLGHGSFLLAQSSGESSHPIKRAVWILDRLLGTPPAPPPPAVPELDEESPDLAGLTLKQKLELHREEETCRSCHEDIDPWGIPLEHFDATGRWGETAPVRLVGKSKKQPERHPVDASASLPGNTEIAGAGALKAHLLEHRSEYFARSLVERLLAYSLGRQLDLGDRNTVDALTESFIASEYRLRDLILALAQSPAFQTK